MKKLLLGSAVLTMFSISLIIFQISCKKEVTAQTTPTTNCNTDLSLLIGRWQLDSVRSVLPPLVLGNPVQIIAYNGLSSDYFEFRTDKTMTQNWNSSSRNKFFYSFKNIAEIGDSFFVIDNLTSTKLKLHWETYSTTFGRVIFDTYYLHK